MHRRGGKSKTALNQQITRLPIHRRLALFLFPFYTQAKKVIWRDPDMMKHFPRDYIRKINDSELYIEFKDGSRWQLGGADNPNSWRGINPIDIVFDEYQEMKKEVWTEIFRPVLAENKGTATFTFTPKGRNHAFELFEFARNNKGLEWDSFFFPVSATKAIEDKELEEARKTMPQVLYDQEFECKFIEGASQAFRRIRENLWEGDLEILPDKFYQIGIDLAKYVDWTVLTPFDLHTFFAGKQDRFNQIDWNLQKARIEAMARRFNNARCNIDSTGVGEPIFEDLQRQEVDVFPYHFTEESKQRLLQNLAIMLEQDKIKIPNDEGLISELESAQWTLEGRKAKIVIPEGLPSDRVISLALAVWGATTKIPHKDVKRISEFGNIKIEDNVSRFNYEQT